ncbi:MAG: TrkA family potassium uptake protein [Pseudomonadota bacterium]
MKKLQVGIIGLGKFGFKFGKTLTDMGHEVLGVDTDPEAVRQASNALTQVFQIDAMDRETLGQMGFADFDYVMISVGESITASAMIALRLKEMGVHQVWAKAVGPDHARLLEKIGVDRVFVPEAMAAKQLARQMVDPDFIEYLPFAKDVGIKELTVNRWIGRTLRELNLTNRFKTQVVARRKTGDSKYTFIPVPDDPLGSGDTLVVIGDMDQLGKLDP